MHRGCLIPTTPTPNPSPPQVGPARLAHYTAKPGHARVSAAGSRQLPVSGEPGIADRLFIARDRELASFVFKKSPLTGEEVEKAVRELPRDAEVIALYKKLADAGALPPR